MRMSCNGCRVLRKGCSDACTIRPCLQWIKTPEAQANATVFLAKFYGRAGLLNLLAAPPADALRPAVFRSLLYEACGRIVNPVYGSVGLLWSGQWQACQAAVEAVLKGDPVVVRVSSSSDQPEEAAATPPLGACDIRHVAKDRRDRQLLRASRPKFKRASSSSTTTSNKASSRRASSPTPATPTREQEHDDDDARTPSHHDHLEESAAGSQGSSEAGSHVSQADEHHSHLQDDDEVGLELTLGFEPVLATRQQARSPSCDLRAASSLMGLRLELPA